MSETTLRENSFLSHYSPDEWPMVTHSSGSGEPAAGDGVDYSTNQSYLFAPWAADNMQYAAVVHVVGANAIAHGSKFHGVNAPSNHDGLNTSYLDDDVPAGGYGEINYLSLSGSAVPPGVPGAIGDNIVAHFSWLGTVTSWEMGIFKRVEYTPPGGGDDGGGDGDLGDCPPRPVWPYGEPSIAATVGPRGVLRGARGRR